MSDPTGVDAPTEKIAAQDKQPEPVASTDHTAESVEFQEPPTKVCPKCSVQTQTAGNFCPHCGAEHEWSKDTVQVVEGDKPKSYRFSPSRRAVTVNAT